MQLVFFIDISPFFGRFHPLFVHLPIGFVLMAYLLEVAGNSKRYTYLKSSVLFVLWIGGISSMLTVISGLILAQSGGYGKEALFWHQWSGIGVTLLIFLTIFSYKAKIFFTVFTGTVLAILITGHFGGNLTHGETYLTEYLPEELKDVLGVESTNYIVENVSYDEAVLYKHLVYPILHNKCVSCHNSSKMKGELNMKDFEAFLNGGENGEVVLKGNSTKSDLIKRLKLSEYHEDTMPPEGKERITEDEMKLIVLWIDHDMKEDTPLDSLDITSNLEEDIRYRLTSKEVELSPVFDLDIRSTSEENLEQLRVLGFNVTPIEQGSPFIQVAYFDRRTPISNKSKMALISVSEQLVWLDLTGVKSESNDWGFLQNLPNLTRLYLSNTMVDNSIIVNLKKNVFLETVSLFGTETTPESLSSLFKLTYLKSLYLGNTSVTAQDTTSLNLNKNKKLTIHF